MRRPVRLAAMCPGPPRGETPSPRRAMRSSSLCQGAPPMVFPFHVVEAPVRRLVKVPGR